MILFDGECNLCSGWVSFVIRHDSRGLFRFTSRQAEPARRLLAPFGVSPDDLGSIVVVAGTTLHTRSDAVLYILAHLRFPWSLLSRLSVIPRPLRDLGYALVARNRHRWFLR
jgi:predicted DCC family thiol-disulfide oxidoreductase YuxK